MSGVGNKNIAAEGVKYRFSATNQPQNRGRIPSKLRNFVKDNRISKSDVDAIFSNIIFGSTLEELQDMVKPGNKEKLPVIVALLISAFIADIKKGTLSEVNTVLDRIYGKAAQSVEVAEKKSDIPDDVNERRELAEQLKKEIEILNEE